MVYETIDNEMVYQKENIRLIVYDTHAEENYDNIRPLNYTNADIFLVCFSYDNPRSVGNVLSKWIPEIRLFTSFSGIEGGDTDVLLVGLREDLINDTNTLKIFEEKQKKQRKMANKRKCVIPQKIEKGIGENLKVKRNEIRDDVAILGRISSRTGFENVKKGKRRPQTMMTNMKREDLKKEKTEFKKEEKEEKEEEKIIIIDEDKLVTWELGELVRKEIGAFDFMSCSSKKKKGVKEIFERTLTYYLVKKGFLQKKKFNLGLKKFGKKLKKMKNKKCKTQ